MVNIPVNIHSDLSKAFDTILHKVILNKLKYYRLREAARSSLNLKVTKVKGKWSNLTTVFLRQI